jgi:3-deoxy-D-manno-octulosonate 8-phosphate phosphatase (KDO 8-P phosphatase)
MAMPPDPTQIESRAKKIRVLVLDVDGVLTDGRLVYLPGGGEAKTFHVRDGLGIQLLAASGTRVALVSGRESEVVARRAKELGIELAFLGIQDKVEAYDLMLKQTGIPEDEVAYVGDDLPDLPLIRRAGLSFAVADAAPEVRAAAHVVLRAGGGQGAVREACERILKAKGAWRV